MEFAQEEARELRHSYVGTEHLLLGLLREEQGSAARVLGALGIRIELVRAHVVRTVGMGDEPTSGALPFTARSKNAIELSLSEASNSGYTVAGTEHVLLGLMRERGSLAARILRDLEVDPESVRRAVARTNAGAEESPTEP